MTKGGGTLWKKGCSREAAELKFKGKGNKLLKNSLMPGPGAIGCLVRIPFPLSWTV